MKHRNRWIMGSAIGLATLAVAIDHTRHRLPEPEPLAGAAEQGAEYRDEENESPCTLDDAPCTLQGVDAAGDDLL